MKLGPDLVPYLVQYQASSMTRELSVRQRYKTLSENIQLNRVQGLQLVHLLIIFVIYLLSFKSIKFQKTQLVLYNTQFETIFKKKAKLANSCTSLK